MCLLLCGQHDWPCGVARGDQLRCSGFFALQEEVFDEISQLVQSALDGYRVCIFAYGVQPWGMVCRCIRWRLQKH